MKLIMMYIVFGFVLVDLGFVLGVLFMRWRLKKEYILGVQIVGEAGEDLKPGDSVYLDKQGRYWKYGEKV